MQNALEQGNLRVMLDGLDEVPNANLDNVLNTIRDFVDRYDGNRFITSCRIAASGYRGSAFQRFSNVTIADFDDEQIEQFIGNWFSSEQDRDRNTAKTCWEVLQEPENRASKELAHTPLLLTYLCLVYDLSQRLPNNRSSLYKKALRILLEEWAAERRIFRDEIYEGLSIEQEEILLSEIAYDGMKNDQLFFDKRWLSNQIRNFLTDNLNAPKNIDSERVLNAIEVQQGILVERIKNQYSFSHLTLQEYLTAQYIVDNNEWQALVQQHVTDNRWREIFLLLPGLMLGRTGADNLLRNMKERADMYLNTPKLEALVTWAEGATNLSEDNTKPFSKMVRAIALAVDRALSYALDFSDSIDFCYEISQNLSREFSQEFNMDIDLSLSQNLALELARNHDRDLSRDLSLSLALNLSRNNDRDLALDLARSLAHSLALSLDSPSSGLDIFCDVNFSKLVRSLENMNDTLSNRKLSREDKEKFTLSLYDLWWSELSLAPDTLNLTTEEAQSLADYLYVCELIIRCKEGAARVSSEVWESVESSILTVPSNSTSTD